MFELWFFFDQIVPRDQNPGFHPPAFRLPAWPTPHGPWRAAVVSRLIERSALAGLPALARRGETFAVRPSDVGNLSYVEVGVFRGDTSEYVLRHAGSYLGAAHLIDPWKEEAVFEAMSRSEHLAVDANAAFRTVETRLCPLARGVLVVGPQQVGENHSTLGVRQRGVSRPSARCRSHASSSASLRRGKSRRPAVSLYPMTSADAVRSAAHALSTVDVVFLDGAHDFHSVLGDLEVWWPRLRVGGFMAGHDFSMADPGVMQAIWRFFHRPLHADYTEVFLDTDYTWWVQKLVA